MAWPSYALRYADEELGIETVEEWQFNTELHRRCTSIELSSKRIQSDTAQLLASIALQCKRVHTLILSNNEIRDEGAITLAKMIPVMSQEITHLDLSGNHLTDCAAGEVAEAFLSQGKADESARAGASVPLLNLSDNSLKDAGVQLVASHITRTVRLRLRKVGCGKEGLLALVQRKQFVVDLDLANNPIGVLGVYDLCRAIQSELQWQALNIADLEDLSGEALHVHGAARAANLATPIASCLGHAGLRDLDCSGNGLGDNGAHEIVEAVKDCPENLERLAMNRSECGILTATVLKDVLSVHRCLRVIELRGNSLNDDCMRVFSKGLAQSLSLEILILAENLITCAGVKCLAEGLKLQRRLETQVAVIELDLSGNPLGADSAEALAEAATCDRHKALAFQVPWGLEKLHLKGCQLHGDRLKLAHAMSQRALLATEAAEALAKGLEELRTRIKERRLRQPHCLEVFGVFEKKDSDLEFVEPMRCDAEIKLKEFWPELEPKSVEERPKEEAPKEVLPGDSGVSTCAEIPVIRIDDSDEEHSPYADVDVDDLLMKELEVQGAPTHRLDLDDTIGSIRDLDELDNWYDDAPAPQGKSSNGPVLLEKPICRNLLDLEQSPKSEDNWYDAPVLEGKPANGPVLLEKPICRNLLDDLEQSPNASGEDPSDPSSSASSQEWSLRDPRAFGQNRSLDFSPTSSGSSESQPAGLNDLPKGPSVPSLIRELSAEFARSSSMGSGKGHVEKTSVAPTKGKGPGKAPGKAKGKKEESHEIPHKGEAVKEPPKKGKGKAKGPPLPGSTPSESPEASPSASETPKAKGPGKGPPKGSPPAKGPGKGAAPVKGGKAAKGEGKAKAAPRIQGHAPLGRKIHWGAHYDEPHADSVFNSLSEVRFDPELLKAMLSSDADKPQMTRRKSVAKRPTGISILDGSRAQNLAIVMSKMKVSTEEFCQNLKELNFREDLMSPDDVELLIHVLPTPEENKKLIEYRDRVQDLRDVEQNVMPFCVLHKGVVRMKVAKFALSHWSTYVGVKSRCEVLRSAADQVRTSRQFREMLSVVLRVGNFINHGVGEVVEGAIRGISVDSLSSLASFKTGAVSTMHFLCLSLGSVDSGFFLGLKESLSSVHEASKEKTALLKGSIEAFAKDVETVEKQVTMLLELPEPEREFAPSQQREAELRQMMVEWATEKGDLQVVGDEALKACAETQKYFATSERLQADLPPSEAFFLHIANFLDQFQEAWLEIERNPRKWKDFAAHAGFQLPMPRQRKSLPVVTHSSSDASREPDAGARRVKKDSQARRAARDAPQRRSVAFLSSASGFDLPAAQSSRKELARGVLDLIYTAVARKRLDCPRVTLRRGSA